MTKDELIVRLNTPVIKILLIWELYQDFIPYGSAEKVPGSDSELKKLIIKKIISANEVREILTKIFPGINLKPLSWELFCLGVQFKERINEYFDILNSVECITITSKIYNITNKLKASIIWPSLPKSENELYQDKEAQNKIKQFLAKKFERKMDRVFELEINLRQQNISWSNKMKADLAEMKVNTYTTYLRRSKDKKDK